MTSELIARGLPASWLNGWLAAVGATVLVPELKLSWTKGPDPVAVLSLGSGEDISAAVAEALPSLDDLNNLAIARHRVDAPELPRKATLDAFRARARLVQGGAVGQTDRSLELSMTDLYDLKEPEVPHAPFDPVVPKGLTLHERVVTCRRALEDTGSLLAQVEGSLSGRGLRVQANGLGFDYRRSASGVYSDSDVHCDAVVEFLVFLGLHLFPFRGSARPKQQPRQRGFTARPSSRHAFRWPCWDEALDCWAVDALLDRFHTLMQGELTGVAEHVTAWGLRRLRVHSVYGSVYQTPRGSSDTYRAFASERLR